MVVRPIRNDADYAAALRRIEELWDAPEGSEESDELEALATLVSVYEDARWPVDAPDAVDDQFIGSAPVRSNAEIVILALKVRILPKRPAFLTHSN